MSTNRKWAELSYLPVLFNWKKYKHCLLLQISVLLSDLNLKDISGHTKRDTCGLSRRSINRINVNGAIARNLMSDDWGFRCKMDEAKECLRWCKWSQEMWTFQAASHCDILSAISLAPYHPCKQAYHQHVWALPSLLWLIGTKIKTEEAWAKASQEGELSGTLWDSLWFDFYCEVPLELGWAGREMSEQILVPYAIYSPEHLRGKWIWSCGVIQAFQVGFFTSFNVSLIRLFYKICHVTTEQI